MPGTVNVKKGAATHNAIICSEDEEGVDLPLSSDNLDRLPDVPKTPISCGGNLHVRFQEPVMRTRPSSSTPCHQATKVPNSISNIRRDI